MPHGDKGEADVPGRRVLVTVDSREQQAEVLNQLRHIAGVDTRVEQLQRGDYLVDGRCLFERKTLADFAASVVDGRLFRQAYRLVRSGLPSALILEGRGKDLENCRVRREALQGAMISLSLVYRLPVLRSFDPQETARLLVYAGCQMQHESLAWYSHPRRRPGTKRRRQLRLLQALPGLGPERAAGILDAFGTVQAVMTAELEALQRVPGIGPKTANAIREVLQEESPAYGATGRKPVS
jgi:DNA excision repair protein ERCC-4